MKKNKTYRVIEEVTAYSKKKGSYPKKFTVKKDLSFEELQSFMQTNYKKDNC